MNGTDALRWGLYYRLLASLSFVLGIGVAVVGLWIGAGDFLATLLLGDITAILGGEMDEPNSPAIASLGVILGILVWQVGKAAALHKTLTEATRTELEDDIDHEAMKSDLLSVLDERLSDMHAEVEQTRRGVNSLQQDEHADQFAMNSVSTESESTGSTAGNQPPRSPETETSTTTDAGSAEQQTRRESSGTGDESPPSDPNAAFDN